MRGGGEEESRGRSRCISEEAAAEISYHARTSRRNQRSRNKTNLEAFSFDGDPLSRRNSCGDRVHVCGQAGDTLQRCITVGQPFGAKKFSSKNPNFLRKQAVMASAVAARIALAANPFTAVKAPSRAIPCSIRSRRGGRSRTRGFWTAAMGSSSSSFRQMPDEKSTPGAGPVSFSDGELRKLLTKEQYYVTRQKGTERAFTGEYWNTKTPGTYHCICCDTPLFESRTKFDSGTGWPSYYEPIGDKVKWKLDMSIFFMPREEVLCSVCDAHLGHVFDDGPPPTGKRYCINSASLKLKPTSK